MSVVYLEIFENDLQDGLLGKIHTSASVLLRYPPIETVHDDGSDPIPLLPINPEISAQTCLIVKVDLKDAGILRHRLV